MSARVGLSLSPAAPFSAGADSGNAAGAGAASDFVDSDVAALAAHMRRCAQADGRLAAMRAGLQFARALVGGRIVTLACVTLVVGGTLITLL